jgi:hypothetical protein
MSHTNTQNTFGAHKHTHKTRLDHANKVGGGQATLTIPGTNIQIPLGPTQPAQQQHQQQQQQTQNQSGNQNQQNANQSGGQANSNQTNQSNANQNVQQTTQNQQPQQQQQQNTVITIPGTNNTIQIPANFGGKRRVFPPHVAIYLLSVHGFIQSSK